jgi:hypothetical protein
VAEQIEELVVTRAQGDALYEALGDLMATLRFELTARDAVSDAEREAADRESRRWDDLRDALAEQGCSTPARFHGAERPPTFKIREGREWLAATALRALAGTANVLRLTISRDLNLHSPLGPLDQIKSMLEVLRGLETLLDRLGWPEAIPLPAPDFPWAHAVSTPCRPP